MVGSPARLCARCWAKPTGTRPKFVDTMKGAIGAFLREKEVRLEAGAEGKEGEQGVKITWIPLEGEMTIEIELK